MIYYFIGITKLIILWYLPGKIFPQNMQIIIYLNIFLGTVLKLKRNILVVTISIPSRLHMGNQTLCYVCI